uniref:RNA-directed RNA polymerase n=1 Tax=Parastrongyloides trichosuri TaxID=131310 RepID=A0A0N4ZFP2_PARTI
MSDSVTLPNFTSFELTLLLNDEVTEQSIESIENLANKIFIDSQNKDDIIIKKESTNFFRKNILFNGYTTSIRLTGFFQINSLLFLKFLEYLKATFIPIHVNYSLRVRKFPRNYIDFNVVNESICVQSLGWGNLHYPNRFYDHFNVTKEWSNLFMRKNRGFEYIDEKLKIIQSMFVNFNHNSKLINVYFSIPKCNIDMSCQQFDNSLARLNLIYNNIEKVSITDLVYFPQKDEYSATFNIWTKKPVYLKVLEFGEVIKTSKGDRRRAKFVQVRSFVEKDAKYVVSSIHESSIFYLQMQLKSKEFFNLVERFVTLTNKIVEFVNWEKIVVSKYNYCDKPYDDVNCRKLINSIRNFPLAYLIEAIFSRGFIIYDQLLLNKEKRDNFLSKIFFQFKENERATLKTLEILLDKLTELNCLKDVNEMLECIYRHETLNLCVTNATNEKDLMENRVYVRRLIVTPTRRIYKIPQLLVDNRMLRKHDPTGNKTIRVHFRSDENFPIKYIKNEKIYESIFSEIFENGMIVGCQLFNFLGSSNSQLRQGGSYFFRGTRLDIMNIRKSFGSIKQDAVPKMMARIGQCFTQSRIAKYAVVDQKKTIREKDYYSSIWKNSNEKAKCFSDGCGMISYEMGKKILKSMPNINKVPSCFQFRFRGYKGVLAVHPILDKINNEMKPVSGEDKAFVDCIFRESQSKFRGKSEEKNLEIVKASFPALLCLNRPLINVMDQVSKIQSPESNIRLRNKVHELVDEHLLKIRKSLLTEEGAFEILTSINLRMFGIQRMFLLKVVSFLKEPFFRNICNAYARYHIYGSLKRLNIPLPPTSGRVMFGVIDETGILEYGQVFIQYSEDINYMEMNYSTEIRRKIHVGNVMITKSPTIVSGDLRIFEAVDVPELYYMVDVVVFPRDGPRPHPDEMAGSDLDGDEYAIFFDSSLFVEYNMPAFDFDAGNTIKEVIRGVENDNDLDRKLKEFYKTFLKVDGIPPLAKAHLVQSDFFGIESEIANNIAIKYTQSLDFAKTGEFPEPLTYGWNKNLPPEKPTVVPDFMEYKSFNQPIYKSERLIGELHRRYQSIDRLLKSQFNNDNIKESMNELFIIDGWEEQKEKANEFFCKYSEMLSTLKSTYGILSEEELFSGLIMPDRNANVENFIDDQTSIIEAETLIQEKLSKVIFKIKCQILETFNELKYFYPLLISEERNKRIQYVLTTSLHEYPEDLKKFVSASYYVSFEKSNNNELECYSFPWIFWDVLKNIAFLKLLNLSKRNRFHRILTSNPLTDYIMDYCESREILIAGFVESIRLNNDLGLCYKYIKKYKNLDKLLFFLNIWAHQHGLLTRIEDKKMTVLFIEILNGYYYGISCETFQILENISIMTDEEFENEVDINGCNKGIGQYCIQILSTLSLHRMKSTKFLSLEEKNLHYKFLIRDEELIEISEVASYTINKLTFGRSYEEFPQKNKDDQEKDNRLLSNFIFNISLPTYSKIDHKEVIEKLRKIIGLTSIKKHKTITNRRGYKNITTWSVKPVGTYKAINKFASFIRPEIPQTMVVDKEIDISLYVANKLYYKIVNCSILCSRI